MRPGLRASITAALVALAISAKPVSAAPSDREKARDKLAEGVRLLGTRDFKNALARFDEAYSLYPSPKLHYNRGLALEGLGRRVDAYVAFTRFVDETTDPSPEYLKHARRELERLKGQIAFLDVTTDPAGAELRVDRMRVGVTPLSSPLPIEPGTHELSAHASDAAADAVQQVSVSQGERLKVTMQMRSGRLMPPGMDTGAGSAPQPSPVVPTVTGQPGTPSKPEGEATTSWKRPVAWSAAVAGAGALGLGIYETVAFRNRRSQFDGLTIPDPNDSTKRIPACGAGEMNRGRDSKCKTLYDQGQTALTVSIVGYVSAAVLGGISAYLFTTSERPREPTATAWTCGIGRISAACRFSF